MLNLLSFLEKAIVEKKLLSKETLQYEKDNAEKEKASLVVYLVSKNKVKAKDIALLCSEVFSIPLMDLDAFDTRFLPKIPSLNKLIKETHAIPLYQNDEKLFIGISDPTNEKAVTDFSFHSGLLVEPVLVEEDKLAKYIQGDTGASHNKRDAFDKALASGKNQQTMDAESEMAPVVNFVDDMLELAVKQKASDLHFECYENSYRVRFRVDGFLRVVATPPLELARRITTRLKIMAKLDISQHHKPQDGRIKIRIRDQDFNFRMSVLPTLWGEKVVLRILDISPDQLQIDALGFSEKQKALYLDALNQPQGMILVTGATGSGKTVTLYSGLNLLNKEERNISTVEDPVEINLEGINQVNINRKQSFEFSDALRAFLRQDPDVIMVGEIRDLETANIAVKASHTGHLVLSTLHTNSAAEALNRLQSMGVALFNIATSVHLIISQRLVRKLCPYCKIKTTIQSTILAEFGAEHITEKDNIVHSYKANTKGCSRCMGGYCGRTGLFEILPISPKIQQIIMDSGNSFDIVQASKGEGFMSLKHAAINKVREGVTSLEEINRVIEE